MLSRRTSKLISAAGKYGVAHVTNAIPNPIVKKPINNDINISFTSMIKPLSRIKVITKPKIQENTAPKSVPPKTSSF